MRIVVAQACTAMNRAKSRSSSRCGNWRIRSRKGITGREAGAGGSRILTLTPVANAFGTSTVTVTVASGIEQMSRQMVLTVSPAGDAPQITAGTTSEDTQTPSGLVITPNAVDGGEVTVRRRMRLTMSCDHRVIDGATGAQFLKTLKSMLENPLALVW